MACTKMGAHAYLQKPCDLDQLLNALKEAYKKRVMNKTKIEEGRMGKLLEISHSKSPMEIMRKLKEIDAWQA